MILKVPFITVWLAISLPVFAGDHGRAALPEQSQVGRVVLSAEDEVVAHLVRELRPFMHELNHPIHTYHYVSQETLNRDASSRDHFRDWAAYFWNLSQPEDTAHIKGLYAATDPVAS